ncbi:thioesterase II family protein [Streptomyces sp. McG3]|uniref:thioesterase II family protein n=1 Tax=Streptomyces sp. McG3 TaxID=2725483 RepID=UPI001BE76390|nr:alpha/beta fold hydrolase [Streptomyces sp. McG3]MBT2901015.1 thioesterase [Streptomyces sp. McG3]
MTRHASFPVLTPLTDPADVAVDIVVMPFGGGGPSVFLPWAQRVPATWRLSAVCLPGRGQRFVEPPHNDPATAAQEVAAAVRSRPGGAGRPLVYLGHSLGSLLALDVAALVAPDLLCVAGCSPPHPSTPVDHGRLDPAELERTTRAFSTSLGPADPALLAEIIELTTPVLQADLELYDGHLPPTAPLSCDIVSYYGDQDDVPALAWKQHTTGRAAVVRMPGDHYFVQRAPGPLVADLEHRLNAVQSARPVQSVQSARSPGSRHDVEAPAS